MYAARHRVIVRIRQHESNKQNVSRSYSFEHHHGSFEQPSQSEAEFAARGCSSMQSCQSTPTVNFSTFCALKGCIISCLLICIDGELLYDSRMWYTLYVKGIHIYRIVTNNTTHNCKRGLIHSEELGCVNQKSFFSLSRYFVILRGCSQDNEVIYIILLNLI